MGVWGVKVIITKLTLHLKEIKFFYSNYVCDTPLSAPYIRRTAGNDWAARVGMPIKMLNIKFIFYNLLLNK